MRSRTPDASAGPARDRELANLLVRVARGERAAFALLHAATHRQLYAFVVQLVRDQAQSEEVTQEVYLQLWQKAGYYDPKRGSAQHWIFLLARRCSIDRIRKSEALGRQDTLLARTSGTIGYDVTAEEVVGLLDVAELHAALLSLSDLQKEAIDLVYFDGQTHVQTAETLAVPEGTAKSRVRDALVRLRVALTTATSAEPAAEDENLSRSRGLSA